MGTVLVSNLSDQKDLWSCVIAKIDGQANTVTLISIVNRLCEWKIHVKTFLLICISGACSAGFCQNSGTCVTVGNAPTCNCPPTHTGIRCETPLGTVGPVTTTTSTTTSLPPTMTTSGTGVTLGEINHDKGLISFNLLCLFNSSW